MSEALERAGMSTEPAGAWGGRAGFEGQRSLWRRYLKLGKRGKNNKKNEGREDYKNCQPESREATKHQTPQAMRQTQQNTNQARLGD